MSYTYTSSGRVAGIQDKTGKKVAYQYNKTGKVESVKDNGKPVAEYSYHEDGSLQKVCFANGIETEYTYDADKNYKSITTKTAEGEILLDYTYQYDRNGNRTQKTGAEHVRKHNGNDSSIGTTSYLYDSLQRLQEVSYPTGMVEQYRYDQAGNRALKKYGTVENFKTGSYLEEHYTYDNRNRLLERSNPQTVTYYQYDNQGNTVSELTKRYLKPETTKTQQSDGRTLITNSLAQTEVTQYKTYEYDVFNKTSRVMVEDYHEGEKKEVHTQENFYDAENLRYGIEEDGERTNFVTNGWIVFTELDAEWNPKKRLLRAYGIVASEELEENLTNAKVFCENTDFSQNAKLGEKYHYYHQNEHSDIEYITNRDGRIKNAYTYDAFGSITNEEELVRNRYTYNGEHYDQVAQQYYLRARSYNPLVGRFTQEDVYLGDGLNLYAYCGNNPVMYADPSGYAKSKCGVVGENSASNRTTETNTEDFYRTMSDKEFDKLNKNKILTKRERGSSELKVTREADYVTSDLSKRKKQGKKKYNKIVKFEVSEGTEKALKDNGATHNSTRDDYPKLPHIDSPEGKGKVEIKYENGGALSYGLGNSEEGLKTFNDNIQSISVYDEATNTWEVIHKK